MKTNLSDSLFRSSHRNSPIQCDSSSPALGALLLLLVAAPLVAAPVTRNEAFRAAASELPGFFAGDWRPAGELILYRPAGDAGAYVFMFASTPKAADETPAAFVARQRASLAAKGKTFSSTDSELYGEDRFATIFISADDTEPVVLRCFKGLPPQVVKEADALALGAKTGGSAMRVRRCLALGAFDEAFVMDPATGTGGALVADMRTGLVATEAEVQARAQAKQAAAPDPDRVRLCQSAWARYRAGQSSAAPGARAKKVVLAPSEAKKQPAPGAQAK
jgi:hypothetical protein